MIVIRRPESASYEALVRGINDKLIVPKLTFSQDIALKLKPFLTTYQSDRPLAPFLYTDLTAVLRDLQRKFVKESVRKEADYSVVKIDVFDKAKVVYAKDFDLGYATRQALKTVQQKRLKLDVGKKSRRVAVRRVRFFPSFAYVVFKLYFSFFFASVPVANIDLKKKYQGTHVSSLMRSSAYTENFLLRVSGRAV